MYTLLYKRNLFNVIYVCVQTYFFIGCCPDKTLRSFLLNLFM